MENALKEAGTCIGIELLVNNYQAVTSDSFYYNK